MRTGRDPEAPSELAGVVAVGPAPAERRDRRRRSGPRGVAPLARAGRPDLVALLGEVDEAEVEAEGADDDLGAVQVEAGQRRGEARAAARVVLAPEPDRRPPDPLDEIEQVDAGLLRDDLAEQRAEQPDLERERSRARDVPTDAGSARTASFASTRRHAAAAPESPSTASGRPSPFRIPRAARVPQPSAR